MKSIKRILAIVMVMAMMVGCFAISASAYDESRSFIILKKDGVFLCEDTSINSPALLKSTFGISYDSDEEAWVLENGSITKEDVFAIATNINTAIEVQDSIPLIIKGTYTIATDPVNADGCAICAEYLTIKGDGTLNINKATGKENSAMILGGQITIAESVTVNIDTNDLALYALFDSIVFKDKVKVNCGIICSAREIKFDLAPGGCVTTSTNGNYGAFVIGVVDGNADTIKINSEDGTIVKEPATGTINTFYASGVRSITDAAGTKAALKVVIENPKYDVTFDSNDGSSVDAQIVGSGKTVTKPTDPTKDGYAFDGWYTDENCTKEYDFATKVTADITLYAKWVKVEYAVKETGSDATWTKGGSVGQKITSTADFSKFVSVSVDGKVVDAKNYDKAEGSTIITFKPEYLETLSAGDHSVVITSTDGSATGVLTIEEEKVADTADNSAIGAFVALGAFAAAGYVTLKKKEN